MDHTKFNPLIIAKIADKTASQIKETMKNTRPKKIKDIIQITNSKETEQASYRDHQEADIEMSDWLTDWLTDWLADGLTYWLTDWRTDWRTKISTIIIYC